MLLLARHEASATSTGDFGLGPRRATSRAMRGSSRAGCEAVALLPSPERFLPVVIDACRTNIVPLFEAVACENPYPATHFPERNFNQLVLKALFNGIALDAHRRPGSRAQPRAGADGGRLRRRAARRRALDPERHSAWPCWTTRPHKGHDRMKIIDPHVHMTSRTTDDYEAMAAAGIVALVEPAFWLGQPRTTVGSFVDYFNSLLGWERFRASQFGIRHFCTIGLNPKEANNPKLGRRGAGSAAALSGQGRRGRRRRDRVRRSDRSRRRRASRASSSWRASSTCRCWSTRRIATRSRARSERSS